jgi:16S rRNA (guanine527-N7)-methyltransferase
VKHLPISDEFIQDTLAPYFAPIDTELCVGIRLYISTLLLWNSKISLTTITDPGEMLRTHFGESLFAAHVAGISEGRVADIGTGPGFPGIPIRMVSPGIHLTLVEIVAKKVAFLGEVARRLALSDVDIIRCRMESFKPIDPFNFIAARALGHYDELLQWASSTIAGHGKVVLLLGESDISKLQSNLLWKWVEPIRIPDSSARFVLMGTPTR